MEDAKKYTITSVDRALDILEIFRSKGSALGLGELTALTGYPKPSAFRILKTLCAKGMIFKTDAGLYRLGYGLVALAEASIVGGGFLAEVKPAMRRLSQESRETVFLSVREDEFRVDVEQIEGLSEMRSVTTLNTHCPLYGEAPSKVLASGMPENELNAILKLTAPRTLNYVAFKRELQTVKHRGYCVGINEEQRTGAISAPIFSRSSEVIAALTILAPLERFVRTKKELQVEVIAAAAEISKVLSRAIT